MGDPVSAFRVYKICSALFCVFYDGRDVFRKDEVVVHLFLELFVYCHVGKSGDVSLIVFDTVLFGQSLFELISVGPSLLKRRDPAFFSVYAEYNVQYVPYALPSGSENIPAVGAVNDVGKFAVSHTLLHLFFHHIAVHVIDLVSVAAALGLFPVVSALLEPESRGFSHFPDLELHFRIISG